MQTARLSERTPFLGAVDVVPHAASHTVSAWGEDVSDTGMFVATKQPFSVGDQLALRFDVEGREVHVRAAEVVWVRTDTSATKRAGIGLRFVSMDPPTRAALRRLQRNAQEGEGVAPMNFSALPAPMLTLPPLSRSIVEAAGASSDLPMPRHPDLEETQDLLPPPGRREAPTLSTSTSTSTSTSMRPSSPSMMPISLAPISQLPTISLPPEDANLASECRVFTGLPHTPRAVTMLPQPAPARGAAIPSLQPTTAPVATPSLPPDVSLITAPPSPVPTEAASTTSTTSTTSTLPSDHPDAPETPASGITQPLFLLSKSPVIEAASVPPQPLPLPVAAANDNSAHEAFEVSPPATANADDDVVRAQLLDPNFSLEDEAAANRHSDADEVEAFAGWAFRRSSLLPMPAMETEGVESVDSVQGHRDDDVDDGASLTVAPNQTIPVTESAIFAPPVLDAGLPETDASDSMPLSAQARELVRNALHQRIDDDDEMATAQRPAPAATHPPRSLRPTPANQTVVNPTILSAETAIPARADDDFQLGSLDTVIADNADNGDIGDNDGSNGGSIDDDTDDTDVIGARGAYTSRRSQVPHRADRSGRISAPAKKGSAFRTAAVVLLGGCAAGAIAGVLLTKAPVSTTTTNTSTSQRVAAATAAVNPGISPEAVRSVADAERELHPRAEAAPAVDAVVPSKADAKAVETKAVEAKAVEAKAVEAKAVEAKAVEAKVVEAEAVQAKAVVDEAAKAVASTEGAKPATATATAASLIRPGHVDVALTKGGRVKKVFALQNPSRVVVDFEDSTLPTAPLRVDQGGVLQVRFGSPSPGVQRVVVALAGEDKPDAVEGHLDGDHLKVSWRW